MIRLKVNGQDRSFDGDPDMPLLWYLRDELAMTGTKFGCGAGLCGACTVHRGGEAIRSCSPRRFFRRMPAQTPASITEKPRVLCCTRAFTSVFSRMARCTS